MFVCASTVRFTRASDPRHRASNTPSHGGSSCPSQCASWAVQVSVGPPTSSCWRTGSRRSYLCYRELWSDIVHSLSWRVLREFDWADDVFLHWTMRRRVCARVRCVGPHPPQRPCAAWGSTAWDNVKRGCSPLLALGPAAPPGQYSLAGAPSCSACPMGTYGASTGLSTAACSGPCDPGRYGNVAGAASSQCAGACSAGYACPSGSTSPTQSACPAGTFSVVGSASCTSCPAGTYGSSPALGTAACSGLCTT